MLHENRRYIQCTVRDISADEDGLTRFVASTSNEARDGLVIDARAWRLDNFRKNPVFMWAHDYRQLPIGKVEEIATTERGLEIGVRWREAEFAQEVAAAYRDGFLNAVSVGWDTLERDGNRITGADLLEVSGVPVPADPDALEASRGEDSPVDAIDSWCRSWLGERKTEPSDVAQIVREQGKTLARLADAVEALTTQDAPNDEEPDAGANSEPPRVVLLISEN